MQMTDSMVKRVNCYNLTVNWSINESTGREMLSKLIPSDTESLHISNVKLMTTDESVYQVISLLINNNINRLTAVDISSNEMKTLGHRSRNVFTNHPSSQHVVYLNISHNNLKFIASDTFHTLKRLKVLDASHNGIKYIDERAFNGLESLQSLHLQDNSVSVVYLELLQSLLNLRVSDSDTRVTCNMLECLL